VRALILLILLLISTPSFAEEHRIVLPPEVIKEFGIKTMKVEPLPLSEMIELPGEIVEIPDREVHVVPPARGFVRKVYKRLGDRVKRGERLAVIDSPELADLKAGYLEAKREVELARELYQREKLLWEKKIVAQESFLKARQALELAKIKLKKYRQKLLTLGFSPDEIKAFEKGRVPLGRYYLRAPISGTIVEMHISRGEMVGPERVAFRIVDLSKVWAQIWVYKKWLPKVKVGQEVELVFGDGIPPVKGKIDYIEPSVDKEKRAVRARVVLDNKNGVFRPGLLFKALIPVGHGKEVLAVPESAVQTLHGHPVVFVKEGDAFVPREVKLGKKFGGFVEILEGLKEGDEVVVSGAFTLKAEIEKEAFGEAGHAH